MVLVLPEAPPPPSPEAPPAPGREGPLLAAPLLPLKLLDLLALARIIALASDGNTSRPGSLWVL